MLLNFFRISETGNQRRYASAAESSSAHDDPRGTLLCHGTHVPITQKPPQALSLETVIIVYNRGTTQIDINVHFQCTTMHPSLITGLVPGSSYSFHFRPPSKVHSESESIQQSHHLLLSVISSKTYFSFSSVFAFDVSYFSCPLSICQENFYYISNFLQYCLKNQIKTHLKTAGKAVLIAFPAEISPSILRLFLPVPPQQG